MRPSRPEPGSGLPAPYEDPWRRLGAALGDVLASLGLRLRELWRRNGQGDLPLPGWWPITLASLFWPLLLALLLAGVLVPVGMGIFRVRAATGSLPTPGATDPAPSSAPVPPSTVAAVPSPLSVGSSAPGAAPPAAPAPAAPRRQPPAAAAPPAPLAVPAEPSASLAPADRSDPTDPALARVPPSTVLADDHSTALADDDSGAAALLTALLGDSPPPWAMAVETTAAEGLVRLRLDAPFAALPVGERQRLADGWLVRGQGLGYERLELIDGSDRLLARTARVGSGMILLESSESQR